MIYGILIGLIYGAIGMWTAMTVAASTSGESYRIVAALSFPFWPLLVLAGIYVTARQLIRERLR